MLENYTIPIFLAFSTMMVLALFTYISRMRDKKQIIIVSKSLAALLIWSLANLCDSYYTEIHGRYVMHFVNLSYIGVCLVPVFLVYTGIVFAHTKIEFTLKHYLLLVIPIISIVVIWTNKYHHLFYIRYSHIAGEIVYGKYAYVHLIYSYVCILIGLSYFVFFSIKNSGFFSKQSILIVIGTVVSLSANILSSFNIGSLPKHITPISFTIAMMCIALAVFKFKFLNIVPIALQKVVDNISDSFVVINETCNIIDYNKTFMDSFKDYLNIVRNNSLLQTVESSQYFREYASEFSKHIEQARKEHRNISFEIHIKTDDFGKYYTVDFSPIYTRQIYIGTIILLKT